MRILVTGGAGFIGAHVVRALSRRTEITELRVIDDLSSGSIDNLAGVPDVGVFKGSILDRELLERATDGIGSVIHLAARPSVPGSILEPEVCHEVNATGTVRVLEAARRAGNAHVIVASSAAVYGSSPSLPNHECLPSDPQSPYAASKLADEGYALAYARSYDLPVLVFRFFNVYGPLQGVGHVYAAVIPAFISAALQSRPLTIYGDGSQTRDMVFVGNVASVLTDAVLRRVTFPGPVNLAFGSQRSVLEIANILEEIVGPLKREHAPWRPGDVRHSQADHSRMRELFPRARPDDFAASLRATVDWFRQTQR